MKIKMKNASSKRLFESDNIYFTIHFFLLKRLEISAKNASNSLLARLMSNKLTLNKTGRESFYSKKNVSKHLQQQIQI